MAWHIAQAGLRQHRRRLVGVAAAAAVLAAGSGAVMALGSPDAAPAAQAPAPASTTTAPTTSPTRVTPPTKQAAKKAAKKTAPATRATTTTPAARAASRTSAPAPAKAAPRPKPAVKTPAVKTPVRTTTTAKPAPVPVSGGVADQVLALVNTERAKVGCRSVRASSTLQRAAQRHSADMAANNYFSHTSQDGRTFGDRIRAAGYTGGAIAENIAAGQSTAGSVMKSWMNSSGHRANILNCTYTSLGVGYARGGTYGHYWTQDFGG